MNKPCWPLVVPNSSRNPTSAWARDTVPELWVVEYTESSLLRSSAAQGVVFCLGFEGAPGSTAIIPMQRGVVSAQAGLGSGDSATESSSGAPPLRILLQPSLQV